MKNHYNDNHETRIALLEQCVSNINENLREIRLSLVRLDQKIDNGLLRLEKKIDDGLLRLDQKIDNGLVDVRKEIAEVRKENMSHFRWLVGIIVLFTSSPLIIESMKLLIKSMSIH